MNLTQKDIPANYLLCFATDDQCPKASHCLRRMAAAVATRYNSNLVASVVDPRYVAALAGKECKKYVDSTPVIMKRGMKHLFDEVPAAKAATVKHAVEACFSNRSYYYAAKAGRRLINQQMQEAIEKVFQENGLPTPPHYDGEVATYNWHK